MLTFSKFLRCRRTRYIPLYTLLLIIIPYVSVNSQTYSLYDSLASTADTTAARDTGGTALHQGNNNISASNHVDSSKNLAETNTSVYESKSKHERKLIVCIIQFLVISFLMVELVQQNKMIGDNLAVRQFLGYWILIWLMMLILYFEKSVVSALVILEILKSETVVTYVVDGLIANIVPALFFLVFLVLDVPSLQRTDPFYKHRKTILTILLLIEVITVCAIFHKISAGLSDLIASIWAGLSISFLAGKLDSKAIGVPRRYIAVAYFYALIQILTPVLNPVFSDKFPAWMELAIIVLSLVGKLALFFIVLELVKDKRIEKYLMRLREYAALKTYS